ncbi:MAG: hypothetical protein H0V83_11105 [Rubrobacter sp.]|nr:hypothetical protein [Rubrobacter sp.]
MSPEPERPEYEGRVVRHLRQILIEGNLRVSDRGRPVVFEDVRLDGGKSTVSSVVITFRSPVRPGCLFGRRKDAMGPPEPWQDPQRSAPEGWADMVWISLMEDIETRPALLKKCDPRSITWV